MAVRFGNWTNDAKHQDPLENKHQGTNVFREGRGQVLHTHQFTFKRKRLQLEESCTEEKPFG